MTNTFDQFKQLERQIVEALAKGEQLKAEALTETYAKLRLRSTQVKLSNYYRWLLDQSACKPSVVTRLLRGQGHDISEQTVSKLYERKGLPEFRSLSRVVSERGREVLVVLEPFDGTGADRIELSTRIAAGEHAGQAIAVLVRDLLRAEKRSTAWLSTMSGLSETTVHTAANQRVFPACLDMIVCHEIETVCRIAAASQYRFSILFPRMYKYA